MAPSGIDQLVATASASRLSGISRMGPVWPRGRCGSSGTSCMLDSERWNGRKNDGLPRPFRAPIGRRPTSALVAVSVGRGSRFPEGGAGPTKPSRVGPCSSAKGYPIGGVRACPAEVLGARSRQGRSCPMPANVPMVIRFKSVGLPKTGRGSRWRIGEEDGMPPWPARQCLPDDSPRVTRRHHRK